MATDRSTAKALRSFAGNLAALTIAGVTLYIAQRMGIRWAVFGMVTIGVFVLGYTVTYGLLWAAFRGPALKVLGVLAAPVWLAAGYVVADAAYDTTVLCGPGFGQKPFSQVAGTHRRDIHGAPSRPCLPRPKDVAQTLLDRWKG